jgi:hypothetical protein
MAVVGQTRQGILGRLLTQMILQLALFGDTLRDNLVAFQRTLFAVDLSNSSQ